jgi:hypothetical protein
MALTSPKHGLSTRSCRRSQSDGNALVIVALARLERLQEAR